MEGQCVIAKRIKNGRKDRRIIADKLREYADLVWEGNISEVSMRWEMDPPEPWGTEVHTIEIHMLPTKVEMDPSLD